MYYSNDVVIDNRLTCHPLHAERYAEEFNLAFQGHHNFKKLLRNDLFICFRSFIFIEFIAFI